jgi:hypothetical protein
VALLGGTVGIKQTKVEAIDIETVRVPRLDRVSAEDIASLLTAADALASGDRTAIASGLCTVDRIVAHAAGLTDADRELLADADRRARAILFESAAARRPMEASPTDDEIKAYARNLCSAFNAFATEDEDLVLVPDRYAAAQSDLLVVKFALGERAVIRSKTLSRASLNELGAASLPQLGGQHVPYLKPAKSLRLYVDSAVYLFKPAHYRCFSPAAGQSDGDRIVADLMNPDFPIDDAAGSA